MSEAEEIKRLAELRDQGLITTAEFGDKKRKILKGKRAWWKTALLWIVGLWCLVALLSILTAILAPVIRNMSAGDNLACETPEVEEKVVALMNEQISNTRRQLGVFGGLIPAGTQVHSLGQATQLYRDAGSGFIACTASAKNDKDEGEIGYTVSWRDRSNGEFWVELFSAKELRIRYEGSVGQRDAGDGNPVAQMNTPDGAVTLLDGTGDCFEGERVAALAHRSGITEKGCWGASPDAVGIRFEGGSGRWESLTSEFETAPGFTWTKVP